MNTVYDEIRIGLRDMPAERAEVIRDEIIVLLVMIKLEVERWRGGKGNRNTTPYRDGAVIEAAGGDYAAMLRVAEQYSQDVRKLLT